MSLAPINLSKGFTLIELVMVIIILGILASVIMPKFVNFKTRAIERSEDAIAGAMNAALKIYQVSYIVAGGDPSSYPAVIPFTLLQQAPPYNEATTDAIIPDGINWHYYQQSSFAYALYCPHRDGPRVIQSGATYGRLYIYQNGIYAGWGHQPGDFWLYSDKGH